MAKPVNKPGTETPEISDVFTTFNTPVATVADDKAIEQAKRIGEAFIGIQGAAFAATAVKRAERKPLPEVSYHLTVRRQGAEKPYVKVIRVAKDVFEVWFALDMSLATILQYILVSTAIILDGTKNKSGTLTAKGAEGLLRQFGVLKGMKPSDHLRDTIEHFIAECETLGWSYPKPRFAPKAATKDSARISVTLTGIGTISGLASTIAGLMHAVETGAKVVFEKPSDKKQAAKLAAAIAQLEPVKPQGADSVGEKKAA